MQRDVAVIGTGQTKYRRRYPDVIQPELMRQAVLTALNDARLQLDDIDAVVVSQAPDALIGVMHAERWLADAAGAIGGRPMLRINTGGATGLSAVQAAYDHVASGLFDKVLVVGADRVGESGDAQSILNRIWDPMYERAFPLNTITMLAMQAIRFFEKYGATEEDMAHASVRLHANALRNPYAHIQEAVTLEDVLNSRMISYPIKLLDACPQSSGAAAMILASADIAERVTDRPAWITGMGFSVETYWMGDRMGPAAESDHADSPALSKAVRAAYAMAGITAADLQVAELYAPFSNIELHVLQDAELCKPGEVMQLQKEGYFDLDGHVAVSPSGGVLCSNPIAVTAMVRALECALQIMGKAGDHQIPNVKHALATGIGGDHQFFASMVLSSEPRRPEA
jgi:acetyl-CoA C-acetyltransferase